METPTELRPTPPPLRSIATALRATGWLSFWIQLGLGTVSVLALLFAYSGRNFTDTTVSISVGIFWAITAIVTLLINLFQSFRYTRLARRFRNPDAPQPPKKNDTVQIVRWSLVIAIVGVTLALLGSGSAIGVMLAKAIALPQGVAIYDPSKIIRAMDILVAGANLVAIAAHFIALVMNLWLFGWLSRQ
ncbi:MAG TPA: DUF3611 family protein [Thermosynechococcaceae cyanobacterium]